MRLRQAHAKLHQVFPFTTQKIFLCSGPRPEVAAHFEAVLADLKCQVLLAYVRKERRLHEYLLAEAVKTEATLEKLRAA